MGFAFFAPEYKISIPGISQGIIQGVNETKKKTALIMLQDGELSIEKIAKYTGLEIAEVEQLAETQTMQDSKKS